MTYIDDSDQLQWLHNDERLELRGECLVVLLKAFGSELKEDGTPAHTNRNSTLLFTITSHTVMMIQLVLLSSTSRTKTLTTMKNYIFNNEETGRGMERRRQHPRTGRTPAS